MKLSFLQLIPIVPLVIALVWIFIKLRGLRKGTKHPISGSVLRPPGESTRLKIEEFDEKLNNYLFMLCVPACIFSVVGSMPLAKPLFSMIFISIGIGIVCWIYAKKTAKVFEMRSDYYLGFRGERVVGEALNQLMAQGYRVYHDLQFEGFNIDHAIVGPGGVFCIETKTRRKIDDSQGHRVSYDGKILLFPFGGDSFGLEQAERNAKTLKQFISKAAAETVFVQPVLVLPGWFIDRKSRGVVTVVNHKELPQVLPNDTVLNADQIKRIAFQLEQKALMEF